MARAVALSTIAGRARIHADMRNSAFASDTTLLNMLNEVYPKLYDELVAADEAFYESSDTFTISSAATSYNLPDDFYKLVGVDYSSDNGSTFFTLFPFNFGERNSGFTSNQLPSGTIRIRYIPVPPVFVSLTEEIEGVAGWDRLVSLALAIDLLDAEESNTDRLYRKYQEELVRIRSNKDRDIGMPGMVMDVYKSNFTNQYNWLQYRITGYNIEFISTQMLTGAIFG